MSGTHARFTLWQFSERKRKLVAAKNDAVPLYLAGRKTAQNEAGKKKNFLRKSVVLGWKKALAFGTLYDKYVE